SHDVNLAEVASVHQILSLLGHKVKVPTAAKSRMYQLVKGREAIREVTPSRPRADLPEPLTRPINPWVVPEAPRRPRLERFGPGVACLLHIALESGAAGKSLTAEPPRVFQAAPVGESLAGNLPTPAENKGTEVPAVQNEPPFQVVDDTSAVVARAGDSPIPA